MPQSIGKHKYEHILVHAETLETCINQCNEDRCMNETIRRRYTDEKAKQLINRKLGSFTPEIKKLHGFQRFCSEIDPCRYFNPPTKPPCRNSEENNRKRYEVKFKKEDTELSPVSFHARQLVHQHTVLSSNMKNRDRLSS